MSDIHRLRALQMSIAGKHELFFPFAEFHQGRLKRAQLSEQFRAFVAQPQAHIQRHLIIARPAGVEFGAGSNPPGQLGFDVHVDIFQLRFPAKLSCRNFRSDVFQAAQDSAQFRGAEDAYLAQHRCMGARAGDVLTPKPPIERDRFGEPRNFRSRTAGKASAARDRRGCFYALQRAECGRKQPKSH